MPGSVTAVAFPFCVFLALVGQTNPQASTAPFVRTENVFTRTTNRISDTIQL